MFTGIIETVGTIAEVSSKGDDMRLRIAAGKLDLSDVNIGDSIAVNGVCLTVIDLPGDGFWADVSAETLNRTTFPRQRVGSRVNLEKAMLATDRFSGHLVSGHVDGTGKIVGRQDMGRFVRFRIQMPPVLAKYIVQKGSICINGISLTINGLKGNKFDITVVPHTLLETNLDDCQVGTPVNLEVDVIARYVERMLQDRAVLEASEGMAVASSGDINPELLAEHGFIKFP